MRMELADSRWRFQIEDAEKPRRAFYVKRAPQRRGRRGLERRSRGGFMFLCRQAWQAFRADPLLVALTMALVLVVPAAAYAAGPPPVRGEHGVVASRTKLASQVGIDIMRKGGNAIDAAVATGFALAVTWPSAGNIGGGGFMVIRLADGTVVTNDHREVAPAAATRTMYQDEQGEVIDGLSTDSHLAAGVPGTVDGLLSVLERHGTKSRKEVLVPAIRLAREGFRLSSWHASSFREVVAEMQDYPASVAKFTKDDGKGYEAGDLFRQPELAETLQRIAEKGRAGFYQGKTADALVAEMERGGGLITHQDLESYESIWREPVKGRYRGDTIWTMPPPSSGVLIIEILNMLEPFDVGTLGFGSAALVHRMIEAERRAYADRATHLGDPAFHDVPIDMLTSERYARMRMKSFDPKRATDSDDVGAGSWPKESRQTTHVSTLDAAGNAVAYTTTLNFGYGSRIVVPGAGFLLNNEMDDFSAKPGVPNAYGLIGGEANAIAPGKRMLSSMSPTIVTRDGKPLLVTGSPGGSTIITTTLQVIMNVVDHGMSLSNAVGVPRFHHQWKPDRVVYEPYGLSPDTRAILEKMGHKLAPWTFGRGIGEANSAMRTEDGLYGMADPRVNGAAAAY
jgi:gamma-glutamyltranspeptidase/glutathione hydrolase